MCLKTDVTDNALSYAVRAVLAKAVRLPPSLLHVYAGNSPCESRCWLPVRSLTSWLARRDYVLLDP
jgi:hypothetical protein